MRAAVAFLTPLGGARVPSKEALGWFPVVGASLGLLLGAIWWAAERAWGAGLAAALVVAADLALTGLLHVDGLADSADGLLPHLGRARRLEVMAEPGVGAFGVAVVAVTLLLRFAALETMRPAVLLLGGLWCLSRSGMALAVLSQPYARPGGLASAFLLPNAGVPETEGSEPGHPSPKDLSGATHRREPLRWGRGGSLVWAAAAGGVVLAVALAVSWRPLAGGAGIAAGAVCGTGVIALARRRLGGYTGDVLGAAGVIAETAGLVVAAARW